MFAIKISAWQHTFTNILNKITVNKIITLQKTIKRGRERIINGLWQRKIYNETSII